MLPLITTTRSYKALRHCRHRRLDQPSSSLHHSHARSASFGIPGSAAASQRRLKLDFSFSISNITIICQSWLSSHLLYFTINHLLTLALVLLTTPDDNPWLALHRRSRINFLLTLVVILSLQLTTQTRLLNRQPYLSQVEETLLPTLVVGEVLQCPR